MSARQATPHRSLTLPARAQNVWSVSNGRADRAFTPYKTLDNHKLLWHGTNVAVVAAILNGGLRIMPHSGAPRLLAVDS